MTPQIWQSQKDWQDGSLSPSTDDAARALFCLASPIQRHMYTLLQMPLSCYSEALNFDHSGVVINEIHEMLYKNNQ